MERIINLESVDSTNEYLKGLAKKGAQSGLVVISKSQSCGKGSNGRSFESPSGGLYLSYLYSLPEIRDDVILITQWTAVSIYRAIKSSCHIECTIKYINDLLYDGKKVCGILTELTGNSLIIGVGINVNTKITSFSKYLSRSVTSLCEILGEEIEFDVLSKSIISELDKMFLDYPENAWRKEFYDAHCTHI